MQNEKYKIDAIRRWRNWLSKSRTLERMCLRYLCDSLGYKPWYNKYYLIDPLDDAAGFSPALAGQYFLYWVVDESIKHGGDRKFIFAVVKYALKNLIKKGNKNGTNV